MVGGLVVWLAVLGRSGGSDIANSVDARSIPAVPTVTASPLVLASSIPSPIASSTPSMVAPSSTSTAFVISDVALLRGTDFWQTQVVVAVTATYDAWLALPTFTITPTPTITPTGTPTPIHPYEWYAAGSWVYWNGRGWTVYPTPDF